MRKTGRHCRLSAGTIWAVLLALCGVDAALQLSHANEASACNFTVDQAVRSREDRFSWVVTNGPDTAAEKVASLTRDGARVTLAESHYVPAKAGEKASVFGVLPADLPLGTYAVDITIGDTSCARFDAQQRLHIVPLGYAGIELNKFDPDYTDTTQFARGPELAKKIRVSDLILRGHGFQAEPAPATDNVIYINSVRQDVIWGECTLPIDNTDAVPHKILGRVVNDEEIDLCLVPVPDKGELRVQVRVADDSSKPQIFRVYKYGEATVSVIAMAIALFLGLLPLILLSSLKDSYTIAQQAYKLRLLFLDPETDTYSLSKLQFYLWTVAALFSYAYLFISRVMVQHGAWPDIPENLPGVIAIAAGTSVGSQFITSAKGSKGAGAIRPGFSDFVTSGGVVAPDRVQMLLWTLAGVAAFIVSTLDQIPGAIRALPTVPPNMLYLMGLSSAGYLGGKLARKAGPVITEITVSPSDPDDAIAAAAALQAETPDFTEAIAAAQHPAQPWGVSTDAHCQATLTALAEAVREAQAAQSTADFDALRASLAALQERASNEAAALAEDFTTHPELAQDASTAQGACAALQDFIASVTQAISQAGVVALRDATETLSTPRVITVRGSNLSPEALLQIDRVDLPFRMLSLGDDDVHAPEVVVREEATPSFARVMNLHIDPSRLDAADIAQFQAWFASSGVRKFSLTNPDGQMAEVMLPLPPGEAQKSGKTS